MKLMSTHRIILLTSDVVVACPHNETLINILLSFSNVSTFESEKNGLQKRRRRHIVVKNYPQLSSNRNIQTCPKKEVWKIIIIIIIIHIITNKNKFKQILVK